MARAIWKGAISFGLVHIPVALQSATSSQGINFDWLDERSMEPVGYKRINKVTGKEVTKEHIVKGVQYQKGSYVVLSEEEIRSAHPVSTQTIDIFAFVQSEEIPFTFIDTPYYLAPDKRGEKVYALLRETLTDTNKVALANVVLHTRQHLAALMPMDSVLVLVLLRWPSEVRGIASVELTKATTEATLTKSEKEMAKRLVEDMASSWSPEEYQDSFQDKIMALVEQKAREGDIETVEDVSEEEPKSADVIDLTELLKRSLRSGNKKQPTSKSADEDEEETENQRSSERDAKKETRKSAAKPKAAATKAPAKAGTARAKAARK